MNISYRADFPKISRRLVIDYYASQYVLPADKEGAELLVVCEHKADSEAETVSKCKVE